MYALIVTYQRLYLGRARDVVDGLDPTQRAKLGDLNSKLLPLEHIYFASIEDLEYAVALEAQGVCTLAESIQRIADADTRGNTICFEFSRYLPDPPQGMAPAFLMDAFHSLFDRVRQRLGE